MASFRFLHTLTNFSWEYFSTNHLHMNSHHEICLWRMQPKATSWSKQFITSHHFSAITQHPPAMLLFSPTVLIPHHSLSLLLPLTQDASSLSLWPSKLPIFQNEALDISPILHRAKGPTYARKKVKESEVAQLCPTLCDPMDCSLPGSSLHGILQAGVLEWVAIAFSRGSSWPRDRTWVSHIPGRRFNLWATREANVDCIGAASSTKLTLTIPAHVNLAIFSNLFI